MKLSIFIFIVWQFASSIVFAQQPLPKDFTLEYKYDAGMFPKRTSLSIQKDSIFVKDYEKGKDFTASKSIPNRKKLQKLWSNLLNSKLFELKIPKTKDDKPSFAHDKGSRTLYIFQNGKKYSFNEDTDYGEAGNKTVNQAFDLIEQYIKEIKK